MVVYDRIQHPNVCYVNAPHNPLYMYFNTSMPNIALHICISIYTLYNVLSLGNKMKEFDVKVEDENTKEEKTGRINVDEDKETETVDTGDQVYLRDFKTVSLIYCLCSPKGLLFMDFEILLWRRVSGRGVSEGHKRFSLWTLVSCF